MKRLFILAAVILTLAGCTRPDTSRRVLSEAGYSNIHITGYDFFGCPKDDSFHTGFTATGPTGQPVTGVVCAGLFSSHIRLN